MQRAALSWISRCQQCDEAREALSTPLLKQGTPRLRDPDEIDSAITRLGDALDQTQPFQIIDQARHGGRAYLLGCRQCTDRLRPAVYQNR
jgi:hypothetical protein